MKTKFVLKSLAVIALVLLVSSFFTSISGGVKNAGKTTTDCFIIICVTYQGSPAVNHRIFFYDNSGNVIDKCETGSDGCCSPHGKFTSGNTYWACDADVGCLTNCTSFLLDCSNPTININSCSGSSSINKMKNNNK
jgi:hypothetical protein